MYIYQFRYCCNKSKTDSHISDFFNNVSIKKGGLRISNLSLLKKILN